MCEARIHDPEREGKGLKSHEFNKWTACRRHAAGEDCDPGLCIFKHGDGSGQASIWKKKTIEAMPAEDWTSKADEAKAAMMAVDASTEEAKTMKKLLKIAEKTMEQSAQDSEKLKQLTEKFQSSALSLD